MKYLLFHLPLIALAIFFSWSCSKGNNPLIDEDLSENLKLKTEKTKYNLGDISTEGYIFISATLTNTSSDTFYAKLGDGYNTSIDQDYLLIAKYTDGYFEKNTTNNHWENLNLSLLIEGSKVIRILPLKEYNLSTTAYLDSNIEGNFRLKVHYYKNYSESVVDTLKDISNIFSISKN